MRIFRTAVVSTAVALAVAGPAACDDDSEKSNASKDARVLADEALALLHGSEGVRMVGGGDNTGKRQELDVCLRNTDMKGTMKVDGAPVDVVQVGTVVYMKAEADFWTGTVGPDNPQAAELGMLLAGKYVKYSTRGEGAEGGTFGNMSNIFDGSGDGVAKDSVVTIDGRKLVPLSKKNARGNTVTLHVPERGEPFPILVTVSGSVRMKMTLARGGEKCVPVVPPADQVIDPEALDRGGDPTAPAAPTTARA
ncbi:hypothetical protein [Embleya sp. NPDC050493]|uniref:hypothetical protein n=1 Tax=Embleya sp. NPDC050493 TaxID=3363989 RepID=UPI0037B7FB76